MNALFRLKQNMPGALAGDIIETDYEDHIFGVHPENHPDFFEFLGIPYFYCSLCSGKIDEIHRESDGHFVYQHDCPKVKKPEPDQYMAKPFCYNCASYHKEAKECSQKRAVPRWQRKAIIEKNGRLVAVWESEPEKPLEKIL